MALATGADEQILQTIRDQIKENHVKKLSIEKEIEKQSFGKNRDQQETINPQWFRDYKRMVMKVMDQIERASYEDKAIVCRALIEKIILTGEHVEIQVRVPMKGGKNATNQHAINQFLSSSRQKSRPLVPKPSTSTIRNSTKAVSDFVHLSKWVEEYVYSNCQKINLFTKVNKIPYKQKK